MQLSNKAYNKYKAFHGKRPLEAEVKEIEFGNELICIGKADCIGYISNKLNGGGTGKNEAFLHRFKKNVKLYCTKDGKKLIIMGGRLNVTNRGIVG